ncbi:MAG TPA: sigma-70 family RNA polymerase sigma factor [Chthoniobacter sp.]|nr:sigma-70 family RNA polymerase sigma factor [Chthoniobacter sp.]
MSPAELEEQLKTLHAESFSWALTCCAGNTADAEDVLQTVYLHVLQGKACFGGRAEFKTWLFSVIRNRAAKEMRRQMVRRLFLLRPERAQTFPSSTAPPDASLLGTERKDAFERAINALPARQREVLHLVFYEDLTLDAAARVMGVSPGSARQHYERGKKKLRRDFQEREPAYEQ